MALSETDRTTPTREFVRQPVRALPTELARKIAAGEVIDRPNAIIRELLDNAVDSGADSVVIEIDGGGIDRIRVVDNGAGMTKDDLAACAKPHATSKISEEADLLTISTLGFRGEALASIAAVSRLSITSVREGEAAYRLTASVCGEHDIRPANLASGTIVMSESLFENVPARRHFLKNPATEGKLCRETFVEKTIPRTDIAFRLVVDGKQRLDLPAAQSRAERFVSALDLAFDPRLFYEITGRDLANSDDATASSGKTRWHFTLLIGEPAVARPDKKHIYIYVNGRRINEFSLVQAIEYGSQGFFPNGTHPVAALFLEMDPALVDFNIHPAKREARFKDLSPVHKAVSSTVRQFFYEHARHGVTNGTTNDGASFPSRHEFPADEASFNELFGGRRSGGIKSERTTPESSTPSSKANSYTGANSHSGAYANTNSSPDSRQHFFHDSYTSEEEPTYTAFAEANTAFDIENTLAANTDFRYIGRVMDVFLLAEKDDALYIIDQHAAHERILYNKFLSEAGQSQMLLVPYVVETASASDDEYVQSILTSLVDAGFGAQNAGGGRWEFYATPIAWNGTEEDLSRDLLEKRLSPDEILSALAANTACRSAVKEGHLLDAATATSLIQKAFALDTPRCPHGRPIWHKLSREDLYRFVQRT